METTPWLDKDAREIGNAIELKSISILKKTENSVDDVNISFNRTKSPELNSNECLALAKIVKADSPFFPAVVREDAPVLEVESSALVMFSPCTLNAEEQRGAVEMLRAVKLVTAATLSVADLRRAQKTDLITAALRKCLNQGSLEGTPYKCKEVSEGP